MALTKRAVQIQQAKAGVRDQIEALNELIRKTAQSVPMAVRRGSHQVAVEWKQLAEKALALYDTGPARASLKRLERELSTRHALHKKLQCRE